jgi:hypothetical protein
MYAECALIERIVLQNRFSAITNAFLAEEKAECRDDHEDSDSDPPRPVAVALFYESQIEKCEHDENDGGYDPQE